MDITLVEVSVTDGDGAKFEEASVANARSSLGEPDNLRFDALRNIDEPSKYLLVEVYGSGQGPVGTCDSRERLLPRRRWPRVSARRADTCAVVRLDHKKTQHYNDWRSGVADMMAEPRRGTKYRAIHPSSAADWKASAGEALAGGDVQITHVHVDCVPEHVDAFIAHCIDNASKSMKEPDNIRFDCLQAVEDRTKFVLIEMYRTSQGPLEHKKTQHYNDWRSGVADMMATPRFALKYTSLS